MRALVIGIGNSLRRDDGVGPEVIAALYADAAFEGDCLAVHQLTPELCDRMIECERVAFVDASVEHAAGAVQAADLEPGEADLRTPHALSATSLLGLTERLYARRPRARRFSVGVADLGHGEGLSATVNRAMPEVCVRVKEYLGGAGAVETNAPPLPSLRRGCGVGFGLDRE